MTKTFYQFLLVVFLIPIITSTSVFSQQQKWLTGEWEGEGFVPGSTAKSFQRVLKIVLINDTSFRGVGSTIYPKDKSIRIDWNFSGTIAGKRLQITDDTIIYQKDPPHNKWKDCNCGAVAYKIYLKADKVYLEGEVSRCGPLCNGVTRVSRPFKDFDTASQSSIAKLLLPPAEELKAVPSPPILVVEEPAKHYGDITANIFAQRSKGEIKLPPIGKLNKSSLVITPIILPDIYVKALPGQLTPLDKKPAPKLPSINSFAKNARQQNIAVKQFAVPKPVVKIDTVIAPPILVKQVPPVVKPAPPIVKPAPPKPAPIVVVTPPPVKEDSVVIAVVAAPKKDTIKPALGVVKDPDALTKRTTALVENIKTPSKEILVELYDNGEIDDDTITVYHNNVLAANQERLSRKPITLHILADKDNRIHEFTMVADNLGRIPPNTALMVITTGGKRYELNITSTKQKNAKVIFEYTGSD